MKGGGTQNTRVLLQSTANHKAVISFVGQTTSASHPS